MAATVDPIVDPRVTVGVLSPADIRRIHTATLDVIESVGVRFPSERALDTWEAHGATVDRDTQVVRVPGAGDRGGAQPRPGRVLARRPRPHARPAARRAPRLRRDRRVRCRGRGPGDGRASTIRAAGRGGDRPRRRCARRGGLPLGSRFCAGHAPGIARPPRAGRDLAELHQARPDREHRHPPRGAGGGRDGDRRSPGAPTNCGVGRCSRSCSAPRARSRRTGGASTRGSSPRRPGCRSAS